MKKGLVFILSSILLITSSCDSDRLYEEFAPIENQSWAMEDTISFQIDKLPPASNYLVGVRFRTNYPYTNAYLKVLATDSMNQVLSEELVNVVLFDPKSGKPNGKGFGDSRLHYDSLDFQLPENTHRINILQYMREEELKGIEAIGFKALK